MVYEYRVRRLAKPIIHRYDDVAAKTLCGIDSSETFLYTLPPAWAMLVSFRYCSICEDIADELSEAT